MGTLGGKGFKKVQIKHEIQVELKKKFGWKFLYIFYEYTNNFADASEKLSRITIRGVLTI